MSLLSVVLILIVVGVVLYLINHFIPMDSTIKTILNVVVVIVVIVWLLNAFGIFTSTTGVHLGGVIGR